jgi:aconitase A
LQPAQGLSEGSTVTIEGKKEDGSTYTIPLAHTFNNNQLKWFKAGSALNAVRSCWACCLPVKVACVRWL